jgi:hypothetical protein
MTNLVPVQQPSQVAHESPAKTANEWWNWTRPASYHKAIVRVSVPGAAGTGCIVDSDGEGIIVITNKHVIEGNSVATVSDGTNNIKMNVLSAYEEHDLAVLYTKNATSKSGLPIGNYIPAKGTAIEICGFGGPESFTLRHFSGPMIDMENKAIVGVNFGGPNRTPTSVGWSLVHPACSHATGPELTQIVTGVCSPFGCRPRIIYGRPSGPSNPPSNGGSPLYPPPGQARVRFPGSPGGQPRSPRRRAGLRSFYRFDESPRMNANQRKKGLRPFAFICGPRKNAQAY